MITVPANDQRVADPSDINPTAGANGEDGAVAENSPAGEAVGITIRADNATSYTLTDSADRRFTISATGLVTVADGAKLNFEDSISHSVTARAGNRFAETVSITLAIEIINVDEITLRDTDGRNNTVAASASTVVRGMTLEATHRDGIPITAWELRQSVGLFEFTQDPVDSSTQGLRIKADAGDLSSRIGDTTRLTVIARTEHDMATLALTITFTEQEPVLVGELMDIDEADNEVAENSSAGGTVGITIRAENADAYALIDSADGRFAINPETGLVTVADGSLLNFEEDTSHSINVEASSVNDSRSMRFAIIVTDVNEFPVGPVTDTDLDTPNELPENALAGSYTGITLSATDKDASAVVTYRLLDSSDELFHADSRTGVVTLRASLTTNNPPNTQSPPRPCPATAPCRLSSSPLM